MTIQVLVVDDVPAMAGQYAYDLKRVGKYQTTVAAGGDEALDLIAREPIDCIVLDLEMPGMDGFEVLRRLQQRGIDVPVIVYTGTGSYDRCIQAVRLGAYGFVDKAEPIERVVQEIENAVSRGKLVSELRTLRSRFDGETPLIGDSAPMRSLRDAIARVAPIPSSVLIVGESGTGKELVAKELHRRGPGAKTPLIAVNSAALPEQLVESELFGHERGAFTGADRLRRGAFETAAGGTLFLDEIGELPQAAQAKLLRVLEDRKMTRIGGDRAIPVTARIRVGRSPTGIAVGAGAVWVANSRDGTVTRIDARSRRPTATIAVGERPSAVVVSGGKVWVNIFPDKPVTKKPAETRMGSGKGSPEWWVARVKPGRVMFELSGVPEATAQEAMRLAAHKLPMKCKFVKRVDAE